jgi:hypothetical protein
MVFVLGPFAARGLRGKKSTPSVGWEVPMKSIIYLYKLQYFLLFLSYIIV